MKRIWIGVIVLWALLAGFIVLLFATSFHKRSVAYAETEKLMPSAYALSEAINEYAKSHETPPTTKQEIEQLLLLPQASALRPYEFALSAGQESLFTFRINDQFVIRVGRFYPDQAGDAFSPQLNRDPKKQAEQTRSPNP